MGSFKKLIPLLILVFSVSVNTVISQQQTAIDNGPQTSVSKSSNTETHPQTQYDAPNYQTPPPSDEYGTFNFNAVLSNLGASGGYLAVPNPFNENVDGSVEAWVNPSATTSSAPAIVAQGDLANVGVYFGISFPAGNLFIRFGNNATINTGGITIPLNQWTHVACTWNGGAGNYSVDFYVNGAHSGATVINAGTWNVSSDSLTIGNSRAPFGGKAFYGSIDEVRYWNPKISATQIAVNRFVGLGDAGGANTGNAITSSSSYTGLEYSFNFNIGGGVMTDYISGVNGYIRSGAGTFYSSLGGQPMAYNFAVLCPFGANDYITVPDNAAFNLSAGGSAEAWVYATGQTTTHMILSRGTTGFNFFWGVRAGIGNKQAVNIGAGPQFQNSDGVAIPLNRWTHVAITWTPSGGNYIVTFYVNGKQSGTPQTSATTWNSTAGTLRIGGWHGGTTNNWNGYLDEIKLWNVVRTTDQMKQSEFASGRGLLPNANLVGLWPLDGNMNNYSATGAAINGSFNTGGTNNSRFSAYSNENLTGAYSTSFIAHATVVNRFIGGTTPNPFPSAFVLRNPDKPINDNLSTFDTITVSGSATLTSINVFMAIRHTWCSDLSITLKAPNGQTRDLSSGNGGSGDDILTFFVDGSSIVTTAGYLPPYSNTAGPEATMGNFGGTNIQGNWILEVHDGAAGDVGSLIGWGLRFNDGLTNIEPISNTIPGTYALHQNYPNPFNPMTNIRFDIAKASQVKLVVYDILGREVKTLVNEFKNPGAYEVNFDASNFASGTYFYKIQAGDFVQIKKMVLVK